MAGRLTRQPRNAQFWQRGFEGTDFVAFIWRTGITRQTFVASPRRMAIAAGTEALDHKDSLDQVEQGFIIKIIHFVVQCLSDRGLFGREGCQER